MGLSVRFEYNSYIIDCVLTPLGLVKLYSGAVYPNFSFRPFMKAEHLSAPNDDLNSVGRGLFDIASTLFRFMCVHLQ